MFRHAAHAVGMATSRVPPEALLFGAFLLVAVASGAIIASENLVLMALAGGALFSAVLLSAPAIAIWMVLIGTLVITGPLVFNFPQLDRVPWLFSVLGIFLMVAAFLHGGLNRRHGRGPVPAFVIVGVVFFLYGVATILWSEATMTETAQGARRFFQYWGMMFALALVLIDDRTVRRIALFIFFLSLVQWPLTLYQRFVVHPTLLYRDVFDSIVGTFEVPWTGLGGSSGVLAFLQVVIVGAIAAGYREGLLRTPTMLLAALAALLPLALGEVNIMFIWLPMALGAVFLDQIRRRPAAFLSGAAAFATVMAVFGAVYLVMQQAHTGPRESIEQRLRNIYEYNLGNEGYGNRTNLNRSNVVPYWVRTHGMNDPVATAFGHGLGSSFTGGEQRTALRLKHSDRSIDLTAIAAVLWDFGVVGAALFLGFLAFAWRSAYRLTLVARAGFDRALARTLFASTTVLFSMAFYNNAMLITASQQVLAMVTFGLVAWMERRYRGARAPMPAAREAGMKSGPGMRPDLARAPRPHPPD